MGVVTSFRELRVYRDAFRASMDIFALSKPWPEEERYALTDQIRRSSRSVFANVAEAWRKRRYPKHFASTLTQADAEAAETQAWLDCAVACGYLDQETRDALNTTYDRIIGSLVKMRHNADRWCGPATTVREEHAAYFAD
ncbi:MAG: four helix bundle protein [Bacteroidota bacterium]